MSNIDERWTKDHAAHPNMEKATFVRNELFSKHGLDDLIAFLKKNEDLHGQLIENTAICSPEMLSEPHPERDGWTNWKVDLSQPHVVLRIQIEVVTDGRGEIRGPGPVYSSTWADYD